MDFLGVKVDQFIKKLLVNFTQVKLSIIVIFRLKNILRFFFKVFSNTVAKILNYFDYYVSLEKSPKINQKYTVFEDHS